MMIELTIGICALGLFILNRNQANKKMIEESLEHAQYQHAGG